MGRKSWRKLWQDALRSSPKYRRLTAAVKGCYLECLLLANDDGDLNLRPGVPLTVKDIAFEMNTKPATAEKWLKRLLDVGLLSGHLSAISIPLWGDLQKSSGKWAESEPRQPSRDKELGQNFTDEEKRREEKREETPPKSPKGDGYSKGFLRFWKAYPRKVGKKVAFRAFKRAKTDADILIAAVERHVQSGDWQKDNGKFIPHPSTWLNGGRWEDEGVGGELTETPDYEIGAWDGLYEETA